jgi:hypothetical protein
MTEYISVPADLKVWISPGDTPGLLDTLELVVLEAVGSPSFETDVARLLEIRTTPAAGAP